MLDMQVLNILGCHILKLYVVDRNLFEVEIVHDIKLTSFWYIMCICYCNSANFSPVQDVF